MDNDYLRVFRAFSDERRLRVLEILSQGEQCACVLLRELKISQPTLSYHMKLLVRSGIVKERPVGPWKYYSIDAEGCAYAEKLIHTLGENGRGMPRKLLHVLAALSAPLNAAKRSCTHRLRVRSVCEKDTIYI